VLALPGIGLLVNLATSSEANIYHKLLHPTGEFAARFMIIAMLASPLALLFRNAAFPRWLKKNRRYFGVAAFFYALAHTVFYLIDLGSLEKIIEDIPEFYIWTGWIAFIIFIPLAITSCNSFVRLMGANWKRLQRATYAAAVLTLLHWAALHDWGGTTGALVHFVPLGLLEAYRVWHWLSNRKPATT